LCFELQAKGSILVPRSALVSDLKREACAELFLQEDTVGHDSIQNLSTGTASACIDQFLHLNPDNPTTTLSLLHIQVDLYDFFGGQCYACLEDKLQTSVGNARLMDRQAVLLKGRSGKPPGPQALFLEV
jgi:hypothetical protein